MLNQFIVNYNEAIFDTDRVGAMQVVEDALSEGASPKEIIFDLVVPAMNRMIKSISEDFDANLAQHFMTAQIAGEVTESMIMRLDTPPTPVGHIVIGTAAGDMHSLGKRIVIGSLKALMIESTDLGVNVPPEDFVDAALKQGAQVIAISAMMMHTATGENGPLGVRRILKQRGLEDKIKLIVGGAPFRFDPDLYKKVGADAFAEDGIGTGAIINQFIKEVQS